MKHTKATSISKYYFPSHIFPGMIREGRLSLNLGVRSFARKIGCSATYISNIEYGKVIPGKRVLEHISACTSIPLHKLQIASDVFKKAIKSNRIIFGKSLLLSGNRVDLPFIVETLTAIRDTSLKYGRSMDDTLQIITHLAVSYGSLEYLLTESKNTLQHTNQM